MIDKIRNEAQYNQVMALIETFIAKATANGGFSYLSASERDELSSLSLLAEQYEDNVLKRLMPLPVTVNSLVQSRDSIIS